MTAPTRRPSKRHASKLRHWAKVEAIEDAIEDLLVDTRSAVARIHLDDALVATYKASQALGRVK